MNRRTRFQVSKIVAVAMLGLGSSPVLYAGPVTAVVPAKMPRVGTVDERYQSYNIEMLEVTGGRFWAPYKQGGDALPAPADAKPEAKAPTPHSCENFINRVFKQPVSSK